MKAYAATLVLFVLPLTAMFAFPLSVFLLAREGTPLAAVIEAQGGSTPVLYGLAFTGMRMEYKVESAVARDPVYAQVHAVLLACTFVRILPYARTPEERAFVTARVEHYAGVAADQRSPRSL